MSFPSASEAELKAVFERGKEVRNADSPFFISAECHSFDFLIGQLYTVLIDADVSICVD